MSLFQRAIVKEPNNYGAHFGAFLAAGELEDVSGQIQALTACMTLRPDEVELFYFRGFAYFGQGEYLTAHLDFGGCTERDPDYAPGHYWRGRTFIMIDNWAEAERAFSRAVRLDPNMTPPYSWRAVARGKLGRYGDAVRDVDAAMQMGPDDSTRWRCVRALAQSAKAVLDDQNESGRLTLSANYGKRAVELLNTMAENGYFLTGSNLQTLLSTDIDLLRERDDFQQLAVDLVEPVMTSPAMSLSPNLLMLRSNVLAKVGQHTSAGEAADRLYRNSQQNSRLRNVSKQRVANDLYNSACCFSLCMPAVAITTSDSVKRVKTPDELTDEEQTAQDGYRQQAVKALEESVTFGFSDAAKLREDPDLEPIRQDVRFQDLLEQLAAKAKAETAQDD
jgi:tetratricopeptide (TPR) repeat protein